MKRVDKPWGYEEIWAETDDYVGKRMLIRAGHRMSLQYHKVKEETIYVVSGFLLLWESQNEMEYRILKEGETYHVKPNQIHRFGADLTGDVVLIEVSTNHLQDVVRLADDYKR